MCVSRKRFRFKSNKPNYYYYYYYLLTANGLTPGGRVTKIGRTYKKWTYIARKKNIHLTKKQHIHLTKKQHVHLMEKQHISQNVTVQYKCNEQNTRYNKYNTRYKTRKQGKSYCRELNPGRQACSSTLPSQLSRPCV
jgi:hypothetical protein